MRRNNPKTGNVTLRKLLARMTPAQQSELIRSIDRFYYAAINEGFKPGEAQRFAEKRAVPEARKLVSATNPRSRMATKKKKKKKKSTAKKRKPTAQNKRKPAKKRRPAAKNRTNKRSKKSSARNRSKQARVSKPKHKKAKAKKSHRNPAKSLRNKLDSMKPGSWYSTTLNGARVKVQRKGSTLKIRPAKRVSR